VNGRRAALVSLVLLPLLWLWPCVFGGRTFVPYDLAQFPPQGLALAPAEFAAARDGANLDVTEVPVWFVPEMTLARDELLAGRAPTWNPHARGGAPLHAHGLIGLCYPPNWLALFAGEPADRLVFVAWVNLALGGLLAFGLLRALGIAVLPAWFGALLFELSGPMATNAFFWMRLGSYVWLPGVLWGVLATANAERLRAQHLAGLGGSVAMTWLAGFPPFAITTSVLGAAFAAWLVVARWRAHGGAAARAQALRLAAGFVLGGLLGAPQVLPSALFFPQSARTTAPTLDELRHSSFEAYGLLGYLAPDAFSHPTRQAELPYGDHNVLALLLTARAPATPNFNYTEYALFVGQLGVLLAALGLLRGRGTHRGFAIAAFALCAGLALFVPGFDQLFRLPLVKNVVPLRWLAPATLFVAWLAALGLEQVLAGARKLPLVCAGVAAVLALGLWLGTAAPARWQRADGLWAVNRLAAKYSITPVGVATHFGATDQPSLERTFARAFDQLAADGARGAWWIFGAALWFAACGLRRDEHRHAQRTRSALALAAGVAAAVQLGLHGATIVRGSVHAHAPDSPVHAFLRERAVASAASGGFMIARGATEMELPAALPPGELMVCCVRDLQFYTHYDGRSLQPIERMLGSHLGTLHAAKGYLDTTLPHTLPTPGLAQLLIDDANVKRDFVAGHPFELPLLDLLGVRYVLSVGPEPLPHTGDVVAVAGAPAGFFVQERTSSLSRAFAVDEVQLAASDDDVVRALLAADFAPARLAYALASELPSPLPATTTTGAVRRTVTFTTDLPTHVELDVAAGAQPWLLLTDTFLPGWSATIDGEPAAIVRGDHAFRLVRVPERACRVAFTYRAPGLGIGFALAGFATAAWLVFAFATRRRRR
jgi:hypothetical protein